MQFEQKLRQSHTKENVANIKNDLFFLQGKKMVKTWEVKAIINGDNDHLFFYPDKKGTVGVSLTKSTWWHFYFTRHLGCAMSVIKPLIWSVYLYVNSEYWNILDKVCTLLSHFLVNMLKNKSMSFSFLLGSNKVQNDELRADSLVKTPPASYLKNFTYS